MKILKKIPYLQNENGNTLLVIVGLLIAAIFISFIFFDFFTTFASKRVSQTGADAAALAAANEIKTIYDAKLKTEIADKIGKLRREARDRVEREFDEDEEPSQAAWDAAWETVLNRMQIPRELRDAVRYDNEEINANVALKYLFNNEWYREWFSNEIEEINRVVCAEIVNNESRWIEAARYYAIRNGADDDIQAEFLGNTFHVMVKVKRPTSFLTVDDAMFASGERDVYAEAEASIKTPKDIDIRCR